MRYFWVISLLFLLQCCKEPVSDDSKKKPPKNVFPPVAIIQNPINGSTVFDSTIIRGLILYRGNRNVDLFIDKQLKLSTKADTITYKWIVKDYPKYSLHTIILYVYGESETDSLESIATATVKVSHSMIAFSSNRDGDYEIFIVNDDGSQLVKLPYINKPAFYPVWSEYGDRIAYLNKSSNLNNIYIYKLVDSTQRLIYSSDQDIQDLVWSYSHNKLVFSEGGNIVMIDTSGLNKQNLFYSYPSRYPSIGKSKEIFFNYIALNFNYVAVIDSNYNIRNVTVEGSTGQYVQPIYRPGSNYIYFLNNQTSQLNYGTLRLTSGSWSISNISSISLLVDTTGYDFSPSGKSIVYVNKINKSLSTSSYSGSNIKTIFQTGICLHPSWSKR